MWARPMLTTFPSHLGIRPLELWQQLSCQLGRDVAVHFVSVPNPYRSNLRMHSLCIAVVYRFGVFILARLA